MAKRTCTIEGCERPGQTRGWCHMHYTRWRRHGDPLVRLLHESGGPCSVEGCPRLAVLRLMCMLHYSRWKVSGDPRRVKEVQTRDLDDVLYNYVDRASSDCWLWTGHIRVTDGYGRLSTSYAHRFVYEKMIGPIPDGLVIDHLCRVRHCVNPAHMELVTLGENTMRGHSPTVLNHWLDHCMRGHPRNPENTYIQKSGTRRCRECDNLMQRQRRAGR